MSRRRAPFIVSVASIGLLAGCIGTTNPPFDSNDSAVTNPPADSGDDDCDSGEEPSDTGCEPKEEDEA